MIRVKDYRNFPIINVGSIGSDVPDINSIRLSILIDDVKDLDLKFSIALSANIRSCVGVYFIIIKFVQLISLVQVAILVRAIMILQHKHEVVIVVFLEFIQSHDYALGVLELTLLVPYLIKHSVLLLLPFCKVVAYEIQVLLRVIPRKPLTRTMGIEHLDPLRLVPPL